MTVSAVFDSRRMLSSGIVYLIGAGPGDPGLITVKGLFCLRRADVVVYDYLANPVFLEEAPPDAERIYVGKTRGCHHVPQNQINQLLAEKAGAGKIVARLKGGDPFLFGRGGEETEFLAAQGIPFEVIPGITAGVAAAAYAGIPLTHRDYTISLGMITGHQNAAKGQAGFDWKPLAAGAGTLVFYMGMANLPLIVDRLLAEGRPTTTPVAVVRWATTSRQETLVATLADVVGKVEETGIKPPAVIIIGEVVSLREKLRWFDNRPLFGRKVLVTRSTEQAGPLVELLREAGAEAVICPVIEIAPPASWTPLDEAIQQLDRTDWLILTSANAVNMFFDRLRAFELDGRALAGVRVAAVGPKTARAIEDRGISPDLVPEKEFRAEGIAGLLATEKIAGKRVLYPRAELARDLLKRELTEAGAEVVDPIAYRTVAPAALDAGIVESLAAEEIAAVTFTSPSTVDNLVGLLGPAAIEYLRKPVLVSIGPQTSAALGRHGLPVTVEASPSTMEGMLEGLSGCFSEHIQNKPA